MDLTGAVIVAAGKGTRMKADINKQYIKIGGKPIVYHTIEGFLQSEHIDEVIAVIVKEEEELFNEIVRPLFKDVSKLKIAYGGAMRKDSVQNGIRELSKDCDTVLIHDGVRPFFSDEDIRSVIEKTAEYDGAISGVPVKDTIKRINEQGLIEDTVDRKMLFAAATPQAFKKDKLISAYRSYEQSDAAGEATDDAYIMELIGAKVVTVPCSYNNIKITTPEDIIFAESILKSKSENRRTL